MVRFTLNGKPVSAQSEDSTSLLWVIRDELKLTGTKYGCGVSQCGACTVHVDGKAVRSCVTTLGTVSDEQRVEGIGEEYSKKFMLDYNFPPFSVGECRPIRGPGRPG